MYMHACIQTQLVDAIHTDTRLVPHLSLVRIVRGERVNGRLSVALLPHADAGIEQQNRDDHHRLDKRVRVRVRVDHGEENRDPRRREQDVDLEHREKAGEEVRKRKNVIREVRKSAK